MWKICFLLAIEFFVSVFMDSEVWRLHYLVYLSKPPCSNKKKQRKKSTIFTFSLSLLQLSGKMCATTICLFWEGRSSLSTCLLWVNEYRPDSCQLCPSTGSVQPGRCRPASILCSPQPLHTWSNTVVIIKLSSHYQESTVRYSLTYCSIGKRLKVYFYISSGQENGSECMCLCVFTVCMGLLYDWIFQIFLSELLSVLIKLNFSWRNRERAKQFGMSVGHRKGGGGVTLSQISFQNHFFSFPPVFVLKLGSF